MDHEEFTWKGALTVFWAMVWRVLAIGLPIAVVIGVVFGIVGSIIGVTQEQGMMATNIVVQIVLMVVYVYVIKRLFTKGFGKYRLAVLEK